MDLNEIKDRYSIDTREFGKVLFIASFALLVVSAHSVIQFQSSMEMVQQTNQEFEETNAILQSEGFQESIQALEDVRGTEIAPRFIQAADAFQSAENAVNSSQETEQMLEDNYDTYRWMVLISLLGMVAGISVVYL